MHYLDQCSNVGYELKSPRELFKKEQRQGPAPWFSWLGEGTWDLQFLKASQGILMSMEDWESLIQAMYFYLNSFNVSGKKTVSFVLIYLEKCSSWPSRQECGYCRKLNFMILCVKVKQYFKNNSHMAQNRMPSPRCGFKGTAYF